MSENLDFEMDMAQLSLRGHRFSEAEQRFLELAKKSNSSLAWCGVALAKTGLVYSDSATLGEVFYCFDKALAIEPDNAPDIKKVMFGSVLQMTGSLADFFAFELVKEKEAEWQKVKGYILGIGSAVMGSLETNQTRFTNLSALGGEVLGFATVVNAQSKLSSARLNKERILNLFNELKQKSLDFFKSDPEQAKQVENAIDSTIRSLISPVNQYLEGKFIAGEKPTLNPDELYQLIETKLQAFKRKHKTWGWWLVIIGALLLASFTDPSNDYSVGTLVLGSLLLLWGIGCFWENTKMTFEKMEIEVKKEHGITD